MIDVQAMLQRAASAKGLTLISLCHVSALTSSQKVACCGGLMERIVAESAEDCTVLLRDATGAMHCVIHGDVSAHYPDVLAAGALLLLRDVSVLVTASLMPPLLIVCLEHLAALMLPEGPPGEGQRKSGANASSALPLTELAVPCGGKDVTGTRQARQYDRVGERVNERLLESAVLTAAGAMPMNSTGPGELPDDEDCLQLADDL